MLRLIIPSIALVLILDATLCAQQLKLSQTLDNTTIVPFGSVPPCPPPFFEQHYWRSYNLQGEGETADIRIEAVQLNIERAFGGGSVAATLRIYEDPTPGDPAPKSDLVLLRSQAVTIPDQALTVGFTATLTSPVCVRNCANRDIVIELDHSDSDFLTIGANANGETAPGYFSGCGQSEPLDISSANIHFRLDICYQPAACGLLYPGTGDDLVTEYSLNGAPFVVAGSGTDVVDLFPGDDLVPCHRSPGGSYDFLPPILYASVVPHCTMVPSPFPGVYADLASVIVLLDATSMSIPLLLPPGGLCYGVTHASSLAGLSAVVQMLIVTSNSSNGFLATTNALEIRLN